MPTDPPTGPPAPTDQPQAMVPVALVLDRSIINTHTPTGLAANRAVGMLGAAQGDIVLAVSTLLSRAIECRCLGHKLDAQGHFDAACALIAAAAIHNELKDAV